MNIIYIYSFDGETKSVTTDLLILKAHTEAIKTVVSLPNSRLASLSISSEIKIWKYDGSLVKTVKDNKIRIKQIYGVSEKSILLWTTKNSIRLWSNYFLSNKMQNDDFVKINDVEVLNGKHSVVLTSFFVDINLGKDLKIF